MLTGRGWIRVGCAAGLVTGALSLFSAQSSPSRAQGVPIAGAVAAPDSGLRGQVLYGPTCPVQRPGDTCERPYQATLVVSRVASRGTIARVSTSTDGRFTVHLRPGRYLVKVSGHGTFPRSWSQKVSVTSHHFTSLTIHIDSGIR